MKRTRRSKAEMEQARGQQVRNRESAWTLFMQAGYALHTACGWCQQVGHCRGRTRERVACRECYLTKGTPNSSFYTESIESYR